MVRRTGAGVAVAATLCAFTGGVAAVNLISFTNSPKLPSLPIAIDSRGSSAPATTAPTAAEPTATRGSRPTALPAARAPAAPLAPVGLGPGHARIPAVVGRAPAAAPASAPVVSPVSADVPSPPGSDQLDSVGQQHAGAGPQPGAGSGSGSGSGSGAGQSPSTTQLQSTTTERQPQQGSDTTEPAKTPDA